MKKGNTLSENEFIFEHVWVTFLGSLFYESLLFKTIPNLSYAQSRIVYWGLIVFFSVIGMFVCIRHHRTDKSVIINLLLAYETYSILAYAKYFPTVIMAGCLLTFLFLLIFYWTTFTRTIKQGADKTVVLRKRLKHAFLGTRMIISYGLLLLFIPFIAKSVFGFSIFEASIAPTSAILSADSEENTLASNISILSQLDDTIWYTLSLQEKLDVMQVAANVEANYLGLNHELNVISEDLEDGYNGYYNDTTHHICISLTVLEEDSGYECLETICHEAYHAYQHRQVDVYNQLDAESQNLLMFYQVSYYKEEFEGNYQDGDDSFWAYYTQQCEITARAYAEDAMGDYYEAVQEYL